MEKIETCLTLKKNLEAVFNSIYDGIISLDVNMAIVNMNEAAEKFFDVKKDEVLGKPCFCDEIFADVRELLVDTVKKERPIRNFLMKFTDYAGEEKAIMLSTALIKDDGETPGGLVLIFHDISDRLKLRQALRGEPTFHTLVGKNRKMLELYSLMEKVARSDAPVLIEGESGVGKGMVAEAIHKKSRRADGPFIKVNCAMLSENLLESELFGHVRGAFTGAVRDRTGRFELAKGGTVFLDEIGEISPATQVKLLTVLQDKTVEAVGDTTPRKVDIRIVSATNRPLKSMIEQGSFREDLYYRLKVVRMEIPPLRERVDDIRPLVKHFMERQRAETGKPIRGVSDEALKLLTKYRWPGNIRELENAIAMAFVICDEGFIEPEHLPEEITQQKEADPKPADGANEKTRIISALEKTAGHKSRAARLLGIDRTTLWRKMKEYRI